MTSFRILEGVAERVWEASWQASVLVLLVLVVQILFGRKLAPSYRYGLWLLVVIRLVLPVIPESSFSVFNWVRFAPETPDSLALDLPTIRVTEPAVWEPESPAPVEGQLRGGSLETGTPSTRHGNRVPEFTLTKTQALSLIWLFGGVIGGAILTRHYWRLNSKLADARCVVDPAILQLLEEVKGEVGLKCSVILIETKHVGSPALFGLFRCRLLLPKGLIASLTSRELRHVFLHEAAHLKRGDMILNWLTAILHLLHWFNPILWCGFSRMRADRELACDALALSYAGEGDGKRYAQTIIKLLEHGAKPGVTPGLVGILEDKNQLKRRITMIAEFKKTQRWSILALSLCAGLGLIALTDARVGRAADGVTASGGVNRSETPAGESDPEKDRDSSAASEKSDSLRSHSSFGMTLRRFVEANTPVGSSPVTVSPDGRYVVYVGDGGEMSLYEIATQTTRNLGKAEYAGWKISRDSTRIAFIVGKELRTMSLDGSSPKTVFRDDQLEYLWLYSWSADEERFVVEMEREPGKYELAVIGASDASVRLLKSTGSREAGRAEFSSDSRFLIYDLAVEEDASNFDIFAVDLETGRETELVLHQAEDQLLGWVPGTDRILFRSNRRGSYDAWVLQFNDGEVIGDPALVKSDLGKATPLGFTSSGSFVYSISNNSEDVYHLTVDPATGRAKGAPVKGIGRFEGSNSQPDWSPDGRHLAYQSSRSPTALCVLDTETQKERILAEGLSGPKWSPDGKSLLALAGFESIHKIDVASGNREVAVPAVPGRTLYRCCDWSHDGKSIYYQYSSEGNAAPIVRRALETGDETVIHPKGAHYFAVSPDGNHIAIRGPRIAQLQVIPIAGGEPTPLASFGDGYYIPGWDMLTWSADSRSILVGKWKINRRAGNKADYVKSELMRVPLDGGEPEIVVEMPRIRFPSAHPNGKLISFSAGILRSELWVMENFVPKE